MTSEPMTPESLRPLILIDVDGVLNPFRRPGPEWQAHKCVAEGGTFNMLLNPAHGPALLRIAEETGAELVWATMWDHHANTSIAPLIGLPDLPVIVMDSDAPGVPGVHHKTPIVAEYVKGRPFVWLDDELQRRDRLWLRSHEGVGAFELIHIGQRNGMTDKHLKQAAAWLALSSSSSSPTEEKG